MVVVLVRPLPAARRVESSEPQVKIKKMMVTKIKIMVEIGENKRRYFIRRYQMNPRIKVNKRTN